MVGSKAKLCAVAAASLEKSWKSNGWVVYWSAAMELLVVTGRFDCSNRTVVVLRYRVLRVRYHYLAEAQTSLSQSTNGHCGQCWFDVRNSKLRRKEGGDPAGKTGRRQKSEGAPRVRCVRQSR